jgi:hypothetical protein
MPGTAGGFCCFRTASHTNTEHTGGVGPGEYEQVPTRIFVFSNLLNPEIKWIPSKDEIEAGRKLENG